MSCKLKSSWVLLIAMLALVVIGACAPKNVTTETAMSQTAEDAALKAAREAEMAQQERVAREKALEAQRLQAAAAQRELMTARNRFLYEDVYFEFNKADLLPEAQDVISRKALWLYDNPDVGVIIEGHCDERGTDEFNMLLGEKRAGNVKTFLISLGVGSERMLTVSYGEEQPVDPGHDEEAWAKNRRVHFLIKEAGR